MGTFGVKRASDDYFCPSTVIRMISAGAQKFVSFGSSISSNASQPFARSFLYPW